MSIPNAHKAIVEIRKLEDDCRNHVHPRGKRTASVLQSALGVTVKQSAEMRDLLLENIQSEEDAVMGLSDDYATRYVLDFLYVQGRKQAMLRSTSSIKVGEDRTCLV